MVSGLVRWIIFVLVYFVIEKEYIIEIIRILYSHIVNLLDKQQLKHWQYVLRGEILKKLERSSYYGLLHGYKPSCYIVLNQMHDYGNHTHAIKEIKQTHIYLVSHLSHLNPTLLMTGHMWYEARPVMGLGWVGFKMVLKISECIWKELDTTAHSLLCLKPMPGTTWATEFVYTFSNKCINCIYGACRAQPLKRKPTLKAS